MEEPRPAHQASTWLFLRLLGLLYLVAFVSLFVQADGLFCPPVTLGAPPPR